MNPIQQLGRFVWQLVPANPILVRVVHGASKRSRHLWLRFAYLAVLLIVVLAGLSMELEEAGGRTLADLAKGASKTFAFASVTQLALMCFLAPVFTAAAITQERDAQTFNILLATPLSNAQIVLGSLMSRLYFVIMLLIAGLPIFLITMVYGGVTGPQIVQSFAIAGATAILTGSLAITMSMIRVGTRRTIVSFYLMIGTYLLAMFLLGRWDGTWIEEAPPNVDGQKLSWLAAFHPFLCLEVALNRMQAPDAALVAAQGPIWGYLAAYPQRAYVFLMFGLSAGLTVLSMFFVRRGQKEGEVTFWSRIGLGGRQNRALTDERRRKPRHVWQNPVAWREAMARASGMGSGLVRYVLLTLGLIAGVILLINCIQQGDNLDVDDARSWLSGIVMIEYAVALVVSVNVAASAITKERESNTLELLQTTPLTSSYVVFGKLRGLISFSVPLLAAPVLTMLLFALFGLGKEPVDRVVQIESPIVLGLVMVTFAAWACLLGLYVSLRSMKTVRAVMVSLGTLIVALLIATGVVWRMIAELESAGAFMAPFTPFTAIGALCDPSILFEGKPKELAIQLNSVRVLSAAGAAASATLCLIVVASMYKGMVRNYDMTLRRQTASH